MKKLTHKSSDLSRRSLKTPDYTSKPGKFSSKDTFLQQKLKESLDSHLDSWKNNKSQITLLPKVKKQFAPQIFTHRKCKSDLSSESEDELKSSFKENLSNLEKIFDLVQTVTVNIENREENGVNLRFCRTNLNKILEMLSLEVQNSRLLLKFLENFIQKQAFEINSMRKMMEKEKNEAVQELNDKYEEVVEELMKKNKELVRQVNQNQGRDGLLEKMETLESLLSESDKQVLGKIEEITEKNQEIGSLKEYIANLTEDLEKVKSDMQELDRYFRIQQESSQSRIKELVFELQNLQQESEKSLKSSEIQQNQFKKSADSYKAQFGKVYDALLRADDQLEHLKLTFCQKESVFTQQIQNLQSLNQDLQLKNNSLQSLNDRIKKDLELALDRIEAREFIINRSKEEEIQKIQSTITKLSEESSALHKSNHHLSIQNHKLESQLQKYQQEKLQSLQKSEKKVKKPKKTPKSPIQA